MFKGEKLRAVLLWETHRRATERHLSCRIIHCYLSTDTGPGKRDLPAPEDGMLS